MIQIAVGGGGKLESTETDVVEGFVVNAVSLVGVFDQLMDGESGVVGFDNGVGDLKVNFNPCTFASLLYLLPKLAELCETRSPKRSFASKMNI